MKTCVKCKMPIVGKRADARYCSDQCGNRVRGQRWEAAHPDRVLRRRVHQRKYGLVRGILARLKYRAKQIGVPFSLTVTDIVIPTHCPVLGIRIIPATGKGKGYHRHAPSIDRFKPRHGYVRDNICVMSARANLLKNDATIEELTKVLAYMRGRS